MGVSTLGAKWRVLWFVTMIAGCLTASHYLHGTILAPGDLTGLWFYSISSYCLLEMTIPFFSKPADSIATAITCGLTLLTTGWTQAPAAANLAHRLRLIGLIYCALLLLSSIVASVLRTDPDREASLWARITYRFSEYTGRGDLVFTMPVLISAYTGYGLRPGTSVTIVALWCTVAFFRPQRLAATLAKTWSETQRDYGENLGTVRAYENPGIALIAMRPSTSVCRGTVLQVSDREGIVRNAVALEQLELDSSRWLRVLLDDEPLDNERRVPQTAFAAGSGAGQCSIMHVPASEASRIVGVVTEGSSVAEVEVEVLPSSPSICEGSLLTARIGGREVLYQVVDAAARFRSLEDRSQFGYLRVKARKIGSWDEQKRRFVLARWMPAVHAPVLLRQQTAAGFSMESIGSIPDSEYRLYMDMDVAVTHNTAVLGVLGSGKTTFVYELISRLVVQKVKVICFDITGQYAQALAGLYGVYKPERDAKADQDIRDRIAANAGRCQQNVEAGGNWRDFRDAVDEDVAQFLRGTDLVRIYNPESYEVWRQDSKPFNNQASMATLSPVGVTRIMAESILKAASTTMSEQARVCMVLEEAHSLIPEWNSVSAEGDRTAAIATAKVILQGRKFGLGSIISTQRTANVMKTVLNQCNTVIAFRTFDKTGMDFLANYLGETYVNLLTALEQRQAIVYGKALSSDTPTVIGVNNQTDFLNGLREALQLQEAAAGIQEQPPDEK